MTPTCSAVSERDEPLAGTAGTGRRWLCVEHPGPWGRDVIEARVFGDLTDAVAAWAERAGARLLCVRRPDASFWPDGEPPRVRRVLLAATEQTAGASRAREVELGDIRDLLDADPELLFSWDEQFWGQAFSPDPQAQAQRAWSEVRPVLVCAHGRRDQCCAVKGRPVASALAAAGQDVWECSHTGGHRFAPSVVFLPEGSVYGRLTPQSATAVAAAADQGRIELVGLRGRTCWTAREQVAEIAVRRLLEDRAQPGDDVAELRAKEREDGDVEVVAKLQGDREQVFLVVVQSEELPPRPASCGAEPKPVVALRCAGVRPVGVRAEAMAAQKPGKASE
ncbi:MAG: sucrase ferredoxin [Segniliparus sp.]|uniref:sucrase ferredoxin n=1 Tax=Segniliparus sp. TaxID=2804064 RepID=UPI003F3F3171